MSEPRPVALAPVPRILLTRQEAAAALGMSLDSFERYVQPHVQVVRAGRMRLVSPTALAQWAQQSGERLP